MKIRLEQAIGQETLPAHTEGDFLDKRALLVYPGSFESIDGPVEITRDHVLLIAAAHNAKLEAVLSTGRALEMRDYPPIQLDHDTKAVSTVGRLVGNIEVGEFEGMTAIYGVCRFCGLENVKKVLDGRWTHLSISADLDTGELFEVTVTPFPAAKKATILSGALPTADSNKPASDEADLKFKEWWNQVLETNPTANKERGRELFEAGEPPLQAAVKLQEKVAMGVKLTEWFKKTFRLSDDDAKKKIDEMKCLSEEDKKDETDEEKKKIEIELAAKEAADKEAKEKEDAEKAKLANPLNPEGEEPPEAKEIRMSIKTMSDKLSAVKLQARTAQIKNRFARLRAEAKITPAELRKIDVARLAAANDETMNAVLGAYETREPVIHAGIYGSVKATEASAIAKQVRLANLENETRENMKRKTGVAGSGKKRFSSDVSTDSTEDSKIAREVTAPADHTELWSGIVKAIKEGDEEGARLMFMKRFESAADIVDPSSEANLMAAIADLETNIGTVVQLSSTKLGIKL